LLRVSIPDNLVFSSVWSAAAEKHSYDIVWSVQIIAYFGDEKGD
jgi:hypothetical protein